MKNRESTVLTGMSILVLLLRRRYSCTLAAICMEAVWRPVCGGLIITFRMYGMMLGVGACCLNFGIVFIAKVEGEGRAGMPDGMVARVV